MVWPREKSAELVRQGQQLENARRRAGVSAQRVADALGMSLTRLREWERGQDAPPPVYKGLLGLYYETVLEGRDPEDMLVALGTLRHLVKQLGTVGYREPRLQTALHILYVLDYIMTRYKQDGYVPSTGEISRSIQDVRLYRTSVTRILSALEALGVIRRMGGARTVVFCDGAESYAQAARKTIELIKRGLEWWEREV